MESLRFAPPEGRPMSVLALGAHCDDIEIGCGGTILKLLGSGVPIEVTWVVFSSDDVREREARACADAFLQGAVRAEVLVERFRNAYFPHVGAPIKDLFESLKRRISPDLVFTHFRGDHHQDHRTLAELTWNTFRAHAILEYEILKLDPDLGNPNVFVAIPDATAERKASLIWEHFESQRDKHWFEPEVIKALMRVRAVQAAHDGYVEAFYGRKLRLLD